jgi:HEAT repeat protein
MAGTSCIACDPLLNKKLEDAIAIVRAEKSTCLRISAAEHLGDLVQGIDANAVDDKTVADIVSLLDDTEDSVRFEVAAALGQLGPRGKAAVPKLLALLPEADCVRGQITSADAIRAALGKMGVTPPPFDPKRCGKPEDILPMPLMPLPTDPARP